MALEHGKIVTQESKKLFTQWISNFGSLEDLYERIKHISYNQDLAPFLLPVRNYTKNVLFQGYTVAYHSIFDDPRVKLAAPLTEEDIHRLWFEPSEVMDIFEKREVLTDKEFAQLDVWAKQRSFTVARQTEEVLMERLRPAVQEAIFSGMSFEAFLETVSDIVTTGHAQVIYRNNLSSAFNTARMDTAFHPALEGAFPLVTYFAVLDQKTTDWCRWINGKVITLSEVDRGQWMSPFHNGCRTITVPLHRIDAANVPASSLVTSIDVNKLPDSHKPASDFGWYSKVINYAD